MTNDSLRKEHEELIEAMAALYTRTKAAGLMRTTRALHDAQRLLHWESAVLFDMGFVPKRKEDAYDTNITVLTMDDEVSAI